MEILAQQRCVNHLQREAVARCPECKSFYCRECVTEHQDRVVCAACLKKLEAPRPERVKKLPALMRGMQGLVGLLIAWLSFYFLGRLLLSLPASFHNGTLWQEHWWDQ